MTDSFGHDIASLPVAARRVDGYPFGIMLLDATGGEIGYETSDYKNPNGGNPATWGVPASAAGNPQNDDGSGYWRGDPRTHGYPFVNPAILGKPLEKLSASVPSNVTVTRDNVVYEGGAGTTVVAAGGDLIPTGKVLGTVDASGGAIQPVTAEEAARLSAKRDADLVAATRPLDPPTPAAIVTAAAAGNAVMPATTSAVEQIRPAVLLASPAAAAVAPVLAPAASTSASASFSLGTGEWLLLLGVVSAIFTGWPRTLLAALKGRRA